MMCNHYTKLCFLYILSSRGSANTMSLDDSSTSISRHSVKYQHVILSGARRLLIHLALFDGPRFSHEFLPLPIMVYYFKSTATDPPQQIYVGKDKTESTVASELFCARPQR